MDVIQRFFQSELNGWKVIFVVLLFLPTSTGKPNFHPVNSCTDIKLKEIPEDVFQYCSQTNTAIHCLPDENNNLGLSCFQVTWISTGKCPSYNSYQGNMDEKDCSTDYNGNCPKALYKSPLSVSYTGCYIKELMPPPTTPTTPTTPLMTTMTTKIPTTNKKPSSDSMANDTLINGKTCITKRNKDDVCKDSTGWIIAFVIVCLLVVALNAAVGIFYKRKMCDPCKQIIRKGFIQCLPVFCKVQEPQNADLQPQEGHVGSSAPMLMKKECNGLVKQ